MGEATFLSSDWAEAVREAVNTPPSEEEKAGKLPLYWNWIDLMREHFRGDVALGIDDPPPQLDGAGCYVMLTFENGPCTEARVVSAKEAEAATFALTGHYDDWKAIMRGYDTNKAVMYRKLMLTSGDIFGFFNHIYVFTQALSSIARIPTAFPDERAA